MYEKHINGTVSELLAEQYFINKGYIVSKPITDFNEYDFVIDNDGNLQRVQVKTVYYDNSKHRYLSSCVISHIHGNYKRVNKKYTDKSFELYAFVCKPYNCIYIIPNKKLLGRRSLTFYPDNMEKDKKYKKYKNTLL